MSSLLAFDTATEHMCIAVCVDGRAWTLDSVGGAQASTTLIPQIQRLLGEAGVSLAQLDAIGFGQGPGAFTGLRTACSVAQGLAFGAGKPVLCLDTLMAVAEDARSTVACEDVWVVMDARMNEAYAARYRWRKGVSTPAETPSTGSSWEVIDLPSLYTLDALDAKLRQDPPAAVAGTGVAVFEDKLTFGSAVRVGEALPRAAALATIAVQAWSAGHAVDPALALPVYARDKVALTTVEREAVKAAKALA